MRLFFRLHGDGAAEARPAVEPEMAPPGEIQVEHVEERLVPAHGDAVLGDAAEAAGDPLVERLAELLVESLDGPRRRPGQLGGQRLDLEAVDPHHAESLVEQVMGERVPGGAHAHHQHVHAAVGARMRPLGAERIPAGEQAPDLESPAHPHHVGEHAGLDLGNVDRVLLLVDAGLHAVVADAVAGPGRHRVVDADQRQRGEEISFAGGGVHLGDALFQRAAGEGDAERILLVVR
jgi:hypothetical protein